MPHTIKERVRNWSRMAQTDVDFYSIHLQIEHLAEYLFNNYEPCQAAGQLEFTDRLRNWLDSADLDEDQQKLFQLIPRIFFIGPREFDSLYETAFNGPVARWVVDQVGVLLDDLLIKEKVYAAVDETWFCGITDSCQISKFYHINNIEGADLRSDWRTLEKTQSAQWVEQYMRRNAFRRVVLLEDFVGSGSQMLDAVNFAATLPATCQILLCPLIVCPTGVRTGRYLESIHSNLTFSPVLELPEAIFISQIATSGEPKLHREVREVIIRLHSIIMGSNLGTDKDHGPYGFNDTGGLTVMHTNCPDNTLPIIHSNSDGPWAALFPRSSRI